MGLTRPEQWTLLVVLTLIGLGFSLQFLNRNRSEPPVWIEQGGNWSNLPLGDEGSPNPMGLRAGFDPGIDVATSSSLFSTSPARKPHRGEGRRLGGIDVPPLIDVNRASSAELQLLPGIGPSKAQTIISYRTENEGFESSQQLLEVKGIGPKTLEKLLPFITISAPVQELNPEALPEPDRDLEFSRSIDNKQVEEPRIDLNTASLEELQLIKGVGPVLAKRIIEARSRHLFGSVDEIIMVHGIGPKKLEQIRQQASVRIPVQASDTTRR